VETTGRANDLFRGQNFVARGLQFRVYLSDETAGPSGSQLRGLKKFLWRPLLFQGK